MTVTSLSPRRPRTLESALDPVPESGTLMHRLADGDVRRISGSADPGNEIIRTTTTRTYMYASGRIGRETPDPCSRGNAGVVSGRPLHRLLRPRRAGCDAADGSGVTFLPIEGVGEATFPDGGEMVVVSASAMGVSGPQVTD
jgi:hypothetical protein